MLRNAMSQFCGGEFAIEFAQSPSEPPHEEHDADPRQLLQRMTPAQLEHTRRAFLSFASFISSELSSRPSKFSATPFEPSSVYHRDVLPDPSNDGTYLSDDLAKLQIQSRTSWTEEWQQDQAFGLWGRSPSPVSRIPSPRPVTRGRSQVRFVSEPEFIPSPSTPSPPPSPTVVVQARRGRGARAEIEKALGEELAPEFLRRSHRLRVNKSAGKLVEEKELPGRKRPATTVKPRCKAKGPISKKGTARAP